MQDGRTGREGRISWELWRVTGDVGLSPERECQWYSFERYLQPGEGKGRMCAWDLKGIGGKKLDI